MDATKRVVRALLRNRQSDDDGVRVLLDLVPVHGETIWPEHVLYDGKAYRATGTTLWGARVYSDVGAQAGRVSDAEWDALAKGS